MRGIPRSIQTPADLDYLFDVYTDGKKAKGTTKARQTPEVMSFIKAFDEVFPEEDNNEKQLVECLRRLLGQQYHRVRIIAAEGNNITTMFFPEISQATRTEEGHEIIQFEHIKTLENNEENDGDGENVEHETTLITLSAVPTDPEWLSVHMPDNQLLRSGFDPVKIQEMLEVLTNA